MTPSIDIKNLSGQTVATAVVTEQAISHEELMTADYVQLSWNSDTGDTLPAGAYITLDGERYSLLEPYTPARANEAEYQYTPQFQSRIMAWQKHIVPLYTYDTDGTTVKTRELDWNFTGSPADAMYMVQQAIKNETGEQWTVQLADSLPATITISSQSGSIFSLLSDIAGQCETEWWADKATNTLYLSRCQRGTAIALTVGDNVGVPSVTASQDGYYTRFYVFGSTRNVTQDSGASVANSVVNKRLTLDPATYPGGYIDVRPNLQEGEIFTKTLYYDDIYPSSKLTISDVRARLKYRLDSNGNKIEAGTDDSGQPIYEQYAIWYFKIAGFDFDPTTIIPQTNLSVHFEDGQLAGRDFELTYHDKADNTHYTDDAMPFVVEAGDYEITIDESGGTIIPGLAYIIPQDGDKVILYNIVMPAEYTAYAQQELAERAQKDIAKMTADNNSYEMDSYPTEFEADDTDLTLGQAVTYTNGDTVLSTRVLMVEKHLDANCQQRIRVGNALIKGNTQQLREEMTQATQNIDILAAFNNLSASVSNAYAKVQREMLEGFARIGDMWKFDPDDPTVIYSKYSAYVNGFLSAKGKNPESGSTPGGATTLAALTDVAISNPQDGQIFSWDAARQKWVNADAPSAGLDETALAEYLTDNHYAKTTDIPSLEGYATQTWASGQFALKTVAINAGTGLTGGGNLSANRTLSLSTVGTAGTYTKVTVDAYGRVTGHSSLSAGDIPVLAISKITGLQDALDAKMDASQLSNLYRKRTDNAVTVSKSLSALVAENDSDDAWNVPANTVLMLSNSNNALAFHLGGTMNERAANIQVGHNSSSYATAAGVLYLNRFGGTVVVGNPAENPATLNVSGGLYASGYIQVGSARLRYDSANNALYVQKSDGSVCGFYATGFVSAKGANSDAGSAVAGATTLTGLDDVAISSPSNGQSLVYRNGVWKNETIETGMTSVAWADITGKPTWIGSTKPTYTAAEVGALTQTTADGRYAYKGGSNASGTWGIAVTGNAGSATKLQTARTIALSGAVSGSTTFDGSAGVTVNTAFNAQSLLTSLKTVDGSGSGLDADMLDGYEATDFYRKKVANAVSVSKALSDLVAENGSADAWNAPANSSLFLTNNNNALSFYVGGTQNERTANIQVGHSDATYYANILGTLYLNRLGGNVCIGNPDTTAHRLNVDGGICTDSYIQVGSARLRYDSANNALYVQKSDGTQCGFYATGFVSTKGANGDAGSEVAGVTKLSKLDDVAISSPVNGQALVYRNGVWKNETIETGLDETALAEYLTDNQYAKKSDIPSLSGYATQTWVNTQLGSYATTSAMNSALAGKADKTITITAGSGLTGGGTLSANRTIALATVGTAGTYTKVTVDAYGRVTGHSSLSAGDIPALAISKITGLQAALDAKMDAADKSNFMRYVDTVTADGDTLYSAIGIRSFVMCYPDSVGSDYRFYNYGESISFPVPNGMRFDMYVNHWSSNSSQTANGVMFRTGYHNSNLFGWRMLLDEVNYNSYVKALDNLTHAVASDYIQVGSARLRYDSANNALYVQKSDGSVCGFYATGFVSAKGANSDAGSAVAGATTLTGLDDVAISSPSNGQSLVYRNGVWKNETIETGMTSVAWADITGKPTWIGSTKPTYTAAEVGALTQTTADGRYAYKGGSNASGTWGIAVTGNAGSATKLQTARSINGTAFDGTGSITTSKWGMARTLTLKGAVTGSVSIDGSGNVSLETTYATGNISALDNRYVNVGGDTMTGALTVDLGSGTKLVLGNGIQIWATSGGWARGIVAYDASGDSALANGSICGAYGSGNTLQYTYYGGTYDSPAMVIRGGNVGIGTTSPSHKLHVAGGIYSSDYLQVGSARLRWDSANNALYVQKSDGTACGFYATGFVSAKGANDGGDTEATVLTIADERNTAIYPDTYAGRGIRGLFRANATDGLNDGGTYHTVLHIRQWANSSGGLSHQLAFTDNGGVWHRTATSETAWGEWSELSALSGLGDVSLSSPTDGQALIYRDGVWKNETVNYGITMDVDWDDVKNKPAWIGSTKPSYSFSEITGTPSVTVSSSSSTNLSVNVEGASKSVTRLYATYLGGTTKAGLFTGLTYSGNKLSVTVGGTTKSVTINAGGGSSLANVSDDSSGIVVKATSGTVVSIVGQSKPFYIDSQSGQTVGLRFEGNAETGVGLNMEAFKPLSAAAGKLYLGTSAARWRTIYSVNSLNTSSDLRLKDILSDIPLTVEQVAAAPSFLYRWKKGADTSLHAGSSAQYWRQALPQAVAEGADGYLAMEYDRIALAAVITTARTVETLDQRVTRLEKENARLRRRLRQHKINV